MSDLPARCSASLLILCAACILSIDAGAAEVYRWKDKNGVVHFGDQKNAPADSQKMDIREAAGNGEPAAKERQAKAAATPTADAPDNTARCAVYARAMVDSRRTEWVANADKIKSTCPGMGFECTTFNYHPEKNKCEPFPWDGSGTFFKDVKRDFPMKNPR
jgi:hypothetical protein